MGFRNYVIKRLILLVPILFGMSIISFLSIHFLPGGPAQAAMGELGSQERLMAIKAEHGLDRPLYVQYIDWLTGVLVGDFGTTIRTGRSVTGVVTTLLPATYWLAVSATVVSLVIGIPAGIISALNQYSNKDYAATLFAFVGLSIPNFWLGIILILVFSYHLGWFPSIGFVNPFVDPVGGFRHLVLPAIALGTAMSAIVMRMLRSSLLDVLSEEYVRNARANGLPTSVVIYKHAIRNALLPTVTIVGINFGFLLGGAVIIEEVFAIPGLGRGALEAIFNREPKILQAVLLMIAFTFVLVNLVTDLLYAYIDPRIKYD